LAFIRSVAVMVDAVQPAACFFTDRFAIWLRWATHLMACNGETLGAEE
jgi:hypothetical protein